MMPALDCACASLRRASRLVTQLYAEEIGHNLEPTQFLLLSALVRKPGCTQASLGLALGFDKTTLSRSLLLMKKNGWIQPAASEDLRDRGYVLTASGQTLLAAAQPGWNRAQRKLKAALPLGEWENALKVFGLVAAAARQAGKNTE